MLKRRRQVAAFILAGGASSRMGRDKGLLEFGGVPLIVHLAQRIEPLVASITLVGAPRRHVRSGLRAIPDLGIAGRGSRQMRRGPLAGMAAALAATRSPWNLIVACDLPYLSREWLDWLLSRATASPAQAVVPRAGRGLEPLAAAYRRECGPTLAAALVRGERKVTDVLEELRIEKVYPREWRRHDPRGLVLKNMNTPTDYNQARKWWDAGKLQQNAPIKKVGSFRIPVKAKGKDTWRPASKP